MSAFDELMRPRPDDDKSTVTMSMDAFRRASEAHAALTARIGELEGALRPFVDKLEDAEQEAHDALQVGGWVPLEDVDSVEIPVPFLRRARKLLEPRND